jgi:TolA-binding protein
MFKLGGRNTALFLFININVYTFTIINFKTKQMVNTNFSSQTTDAVLTEQQYRIEALQNKIEELKAILQVNNLI